MVASCVLALLYRLSATEACERVQCYRNSRRAVRGVRMTHAQRMCVDELVAAVRADGWRVAATHQAGVRDAEGGSRAAAAVPPVQTFSQSDRSWRKAADRAIRRVRDRVLGRAVHPEDAKYSTLLVHGDGLRNLSDLRHRLKRALGGDLRRHFRGPRELADVINASRGMRGAPGGPVTREEAELIARELATPGADMIADGLSGESLLHHIQGLDVPGQRIRDTVRQAFAQMGNLGGDPTFGEHDARRHRDGLARGAVPLGGDGRPTISLRALQRAFNADKDPRVFEGYITREDAVRTLSEGFRNAANLARDGTGPWAVEGAGTNGPGGGPGGPARFDGGSSRGALDPPVPLAVWEDFHAALQAQHPKVQQVLATLVGQVWRKCSNKGRDVDPTAGTDPACAAFRSVLWEMWSMEKAPYVPVRTGEQHHHAHEAPPLTAAAAVERLRENVLLGMRRGGERNDGVRGLWDLRRRLQAAGAAGAGRGAACAAERTVLGTEEFLRAMRCFTEQHPKDMSVHPLAERDLWTIARFFAPRGENLGQNLENSRLGRGDAGVDGVALYEDVRGEYTTKRRRLAERAFDHLDEAKRGRLRRTAVVQAYCAQKHPDVLSGRRTLQQVRAEFADCLGGDASGWVTLDDFDEYFSMVSGAATPHASGPRGMRAGGDRDPEKQETYYEMVIFNCFELFGAKRGSRLADRRGTSHGTGSHRRPDPAQHVPHVNRSFLSTLSLADHGVGDRARDDLRGGRKFPHEHGYDPLAAESERTPGHLAALLARMRGMIARRGVRGYFDLRDRLRSMRGHGALTLEELTRVVRGFGFSLSGREVAVIFDMVRSRREDAQPAGTIDGDAFLKVLRAGMSEHRRNVVRAVFEAVAGRTPTQEADGVLYNVEGKLDASLFHARFDQDNHPRVLSGERRAEDVLAEFRDTFPRSGLLDFRALERYYEAVSLTIPFVEPSDAEWDLTLWKCWQLARRPAVEASWMRQKPWFGKNSMFSEKYPHRYEHHGDSGHVERGAQIGSKDGKGHGGRGGGNTHDLTARFREEERRMTEQYRDMRLHRAKTGVRKPVQCVTQYEYAAGTRPRIVGKPSRVGEHGHPDAMPRHDARLSSVLQRLRRALWQREAPGSLRLRAEMERRDADSTRELSRAELCAAFAACNVGLSEREADVVERAFGRTRPARGYFRPATANQKSRETVVRYADFLGALNGELGEWRLDVLMMAWKKLDEYAQGFVPLDTLRRHFNPMFHPAVKRSQNNPCTFKHKTTVMSPEAVVKEQMEGLARYGGNIRRADFIDFYTHKGASIEDDHYFQLLVWNEWQVTQRKRGTQYCYQSNSRWNAKTTL
jgi:Ca2+-binding EF-hand superfamily protein